MNESIKVGRFDVLISGTILASEGDDIQIRLPTTEIDPNEMFVIFKFANTDSKKPSSIEWDSSVAEKITIVLNNWTNHLGTSIDGPVHIGSFEGNCICFFPINLLEEQSA
jgi:hypothetical protein